MKELMWRLACAGLELCGIITTVHVLNYLIGGAT